jgi:heme/copper-type cytochrome/quinol oxidase subunit 2
MRFGVRLGIVAALTAAAGLTVAPSPAALSSAASSIAVQVQGPTERPFSLIARRYAFAPARIEVFQGDLVRIELSAEDIAHSFTLDDYRIDKRVSPGQPVTFEFRAERAGTFPFYCNIQNEAGCRKMRGELLVKPRQ